jgi:Ca2+-binding EF-hand superfamily protein
MGNQKSTSLPPQLVEELETMTAFSYAEINDLYRQFRNDCPDLRMTATQFRNLYKETFPNGNPDKFAEHVFQAFDKENKGYIDFRQFLTTLSAQLKGNFEEKLEWLFSLYHASNVNYITKENLLEMISAIYNLHGGSLPSGQHFSPEELTEHIMKTSASTAAPGRLYKDDFLRAAISSNTLASILMGTIKAADSPYLRRKQRRGSLGIPLHHAAADKRAAEMLQHEGTRRPSDSASDNSIKGAQAGAVGTSTPARRPSLTPEMLDFNSMGKQHKH